MSSRPTWATSEEFQESLGYLERWYLQNKQTNIELFRTI